MFRKKCGDDNMPRIARVRCEGAYYHIMCRSVSEIQFFKDDTDKIKYLKLIKKSLIELGGILVAYCLMDNHLHLVINPCNADISKVMKKINVSYALYFNKKYQRRGPVFCDRFKSKIIKDERYMLNVVLYIHCNPVDLKGFSYKNIKRYRFSSLSYYLGLKSDEFDIVNKDIILLYLNSDIFKATSDFKILLDYYIDRKGYEGNNNDLVMPQEELKNYILQFQAENSFQYISDKYIKLNNVNSEEIINAVLKYFNINNRRIKNQKYNPRILLPKAICFLLLRSVCDYSRKQICKIFGNITNSNVYYLCKKGVKYLEDNDNGFNTLNQIIDMAI